MSEKKTEIKTVLITGASGLIGKKLSEKFIANNFRCIGIDICDNDENNLEHHIIDLSSNDSSTTNKLISILNSINEPFSLIHAAGIDFKFDKNHDEISADKLLMENPNEFIKIVEANLFMTYSIIFESIRRMEKINGGNILLLGSIYGKVAPNLNLYKNDNDSYFAIKPFSYSISKSTFPMFSKLIASRFTSKNIKCINLEPHAIIDEPLEQFKKNFHKISPSKELGSIDELCRLIFMLASNQLSYLTGTTITIDGGWSSI